MPTLATYGMQLCCICDSIISVDDEECGNCNDLKKDQVVYCRPNMKPLTEAQREYLNQLKAEIINKKYNQ